jgi:hypothetical protein
MSTGQVFFPSLFSFTSKRSSSVAIKTSMPPLAGSLQHEDLCVNQKGQALRHGLSDRVENLIIRGMSLPERSRLLSAGTSLSSLDLLSILDDFASVVVSSQVRITAPFGVD